MSSFRYCVSIRAQTFQEKRRRETMEWNYCCTFEGWKMKLRLRRWVWERFFGATMDSSWVWKEFVFFTFVYPTLCPGFCWLIDFNWPFVLRWENQYKRNIISRDFFSSPRHPNSFCFLSHFVGKWEGRYEERRQIKHSRHERIRFEIHFICLFARKCRGSGNICLFFSTLSPTLNSTTSLWQSVNASEAVCGLEAMTSYLLDIYRKSQIFQGCQ